MSHSHTTANTAQYKSRFTEHISHDMSNSHQNMYLNPQKIESITARRGSTRSFEDFIRLEKMSTWEAEDAKAAMKRREMVRRLKEKARVLAVTAGKVGSFASKKEGYAEF